MDRHKGCRLRAQSALAQRYGNISICFCQTDFIDREITLGTYQHRGIAFGKNIQQIGLLSPLTSNL